MHASRFALALALLGSLLGGVLLSPSPARMAGPWTPAAPPAIIVDPLLPFNSNVPGNASALLPLGNGQLLLTGRPKGGGNHVSQRYDPATDRWSAPVSLTTARDRYATIRLADDRVLAIGGETLSNRELSCVSSTVECTTATVERYDPATDRWMPVTPMGTPRGVPTATLLADGRVLVTGGSVNSWSNRPTATVEIYDPVRDVWTPVASMAGERRGHTATQLPDGRVLVVGGVGNLYSDVELYDPATNRWVAAEPRHTRWFFNTATLLTNGQVLVLGPESVERYDPVSNHWFPAAPLPTPEGEPNWRQYFSVTPLADGQILVSGGLAHTYRHNPPNPTREVPIPLKDTVRYDPATDRWTADAPLNTTRFGHLTATLPDGRVLAVGGDREASYDTAELYTPPQACFTETGKCLQGRFLIYWQAHGGLAINGYPLSNEFEQTLEDGKTYRVQYFERTRLEYHPEYIGTPYEVLLGQFGRRIYQSRTGHDVDPPVPPLPDARYFPQIGHNLGGSFRRFWEANGGEAQFGLPISEERREVLEDGQEYTVQYFERARFEYHPGDTPIDVQLGQFGRQILAGGGSGR